MEIYYKTRRNSVACVNFVRELFDNNTSFCGKRVANS
jgi:hypothetical protein